MGGTQGNFIKVKTFLTWKLGKMSFSLYTLTESKRKNLKYTPPPPIDQKTMFCHRAEGGEDSATLPGGKKIVSFSFKKSHS